mmetsp:Transcript_18705/g.40694  ORF Transcript_18705/g.40694 Transcript_18705/m.40694 type:complete len:82 (+) Transcript_18705:2371-2616(+)
MLNSSDMTRWYSVPSTREVVVRRCGGVSSSIHPAWTTVIAVVVDAARSSSERLFMVVVLMCVVYVTLLGRERERETKQHDQ